MTIFFTFWGLTVLRRPEKVHVKKSFMEKMFGVMLPRGSAKLKLSRLNMGGMGTAMMKENSAAAWRLMPINMPPLMVAPEREKPGQSARHWNRPTPNACL